MHRRAILAAPLAVAVACGKKKTEEDRVRESLDAAEKGAEAPKLRDVMDRISDSFKSDTGADKDTIKGVLAGEILRGGAITVVRRNEKIAVEGETAKASFDALVTRGKQGGGALPADAGAYHFDLTLAKEADGEWRVTGAEWKEIPASGLLPK